MAGDLTMPRGAAVKLLLVLAAVLGAIAWWQYRQAEAAREQLGLDAARVLSAVFSQASELRVATLKGEALARSSNKGRVFTTEQETRAPYSVSYFVDLRKVGRGDYQWDAERRRMIVHIPDIAVERPSVAMDRAEVRQKGAWISREAGINLNRQGAAFLASAATRAARSEENMASARQAAQGAVARLVQQPLAAAGFDGVTVEVSFPWEGSSSPECWERSRAVKDVLGAPR